MKSMDTYGDSQMGTPDPAQMITRKEAASLISFSTSTIKRWEKQGILTPHYSPSGKPRYLRSDVLAAMQKTA